MFFGHRVGRYFYVLRDPQKASPLLLGEGLGVRAFLNRYKVLLKLLILIVLLNLPLPARGDIYQWAWVDPTDPTQGKYQTTSPCPGGTGVDALPGANLQSKDLTQAYLIGADLTGGNGKFVTLTNADLSQANLTGASLYQSTLTGANFTDAQIQGVDLEFTTHLGFTLAQLQSTASYKNKNLSGVKLTGFMVLNGWDLSGQNLTGASFAESDMTNAILTDAIVRNTDFTYGSSPAGITPSQLYSTASYKAKDLSGIKLVYNSVQTLKGWDFTDQNLTGAYFNGSWLIKCNFYKSYKCFL
jgi:uncharacterized protein YjbI with pentapeptide repeats